MLGLQTFHRNKTFVCHATNVFVSNHYSVRVRSESDPTEVLAISQILHPSQRASFDLVLDSINLICWTKRAGVARNSEMKKLQSRHFSGTEIAGLAADAFVNRVRQPL